MKQYGSKEADLPIGKIVLILSFLMVVIAGGFWWYADMESSRQAGDFLITAKDNFRLNQNESAITNVDRALKLKTTPEALELKANVLIRQNKVFQADDVLQQLVKLRPNNAHYHYLIATMALNEEDNLKGVNHLKKALEIEPENALYGVALGNMLYKYNDVDAAKKQFESILKKDAKYKVAWVQYATQFSNGGEHEEAVKITQRALKQLPDDSDLYFLLATNYDFLKQHSAAARAYIKSLELEPSEDSIAAQRYFEITGKHVPLALEKKKTDEIPFEKRHNLMFVDAYVNRKKGHFLLDTGASLSVIYQSKAAYYQLQKSPLRTEVETAGGIIQVPLAYATINLGRSQESLVLGVIPDGKHMKADGIIGMDFFGKFQMDIDKGRQKISLER